MILIEYCHGLKSVMAKNIKWNKVKNYFELIIIIEFCHILSVSKFDL